MDLKDLEAESIYIIREAYNKFRHLGFLWSMGKDSTVLLWLIRKSFFGHIPFPVIHIDTTYKIPSMIEYRDKIAKEIGFKLIVGKNIKALNQNMNHKMGRQTCCHALKTQGLIDITRQYDIRSLFVGIRHDEEGSRGKEKIFSPREQNYSWNHKDQPPEFWDQYNTNFPEDVHIRIHAILRWTELDIWRYIKQENIPLIDLYFSKNGKRYRSIGCHPCTATIDSEAETVDEIIEELEITHESERSGRAQDKEGDYAMQNLRTQGYM